MKSEWLFFEDFQSYLLRVALGFVLFFAALPEVANEATKVFKSLEYETATQLFSFIYFIVPGITVLFIWLWWISKDANGFLRFRTLSKSKVINKGLTTLVIVWLLGQTIFVLFQGTQEFLKHVLFYSSILIFLATVIYTIQIILKYKNSNLRSKEAKRFHTLGLVHFAGLFIIILILCIGYFFKVSEVFPQKEKQGLYLSPVLEKSLSTDTIQAVFQAKTLQDSITNLSKDLKSLSDSLRVEIRMQLLEGKIGKLNKLHEDTLINSLGLVYRRFSQNPKHWNTSQNNQQDSIWVKDLKYRTRAILIDTLTRRTNHLYPSFHYLREFGKVSDNFRGKANGLFLEKFGKYLELIYFYGVVIHFLALFFLAALWMHFFFENLIKFDKSIHRKKGQKENSLNAKREIRTVKALFLLILLLILPTFRNLSKDSLSKRNPLQPLFFEGGSFRTENSSRDTILYIPESIDEKFKDLHKHLNLQHDESHKWLQKLVDDRIDSVNISTPKKIYPRK
jgi:hypothetical protein